MRKKLVDVKEWNLFKIWKTFKIFR
jgi:hypothetical protein